ncbi:hypothetical protein C1I98_35205 [Spongiactinospora gelatinilytica]|uniref:Uncharacterized protein n=1 Tax=Spongiactinospora gelatinilytica TaxID=2666298 RepID=A0A2W2EQX5_9ACTN|nr:hypothetical protein [Spongiactinospora gelatinilytica]PZG24793.1 hypothetical protein C1I98_35205 [Spongiactinospora gelatinilytica]
MSGTPVSWFSPPESAPGEAPAPGAPGQKDAGSARDKAASAEGSAPAQRGAGASEAGRNGTDDASAPAKGKAGKGDAPAIGGEPRVVADDATRVVVTVDEENSDPGHRPSPAPAQSVKVISGTKRFHTTGCPLLRAATDDVVETMPRARAEAAGFTHCSVCGTTA